ncbi:MAG: hypothetical protein H0W36_02805, partial [Gemmatimonadetes bacterium]|nr:hypothetical protein [Gemmatimonadota bacterium]
MSTTYAELKTRVATVLQDPNARTFTDGLIEELILSALTEVGRIAPEQFTEDIDLVANQLTYAVRSAAFGGLAVPEVEVMRVEVWDASVAPERFLGRILPASQQPIGGIDSGWYMWGGELTIPTRVASGLIGYELTRLIRVWGYSPYVLPVADADVIAISKEVEQAAIWFCRLEAIDLLLASRDLFTQWQTRSGNTDMSPAALMNQRSIAEQAW